MLRQAAADFFYCLVRFHFKALALLARLRLLGVLGVHLCRRISRRLAITPELEPG